MFVFIDDSGDCGLDFTGGSSTHLVMSAVVLRDREAIRQAMSAVASARYAVTPEGKEIVYKREFKYYSSSAQMKERFFDSLKSVPFDLRAIILDKRSLRSGHLRENPNSMKSYLIRQMLCNTRGTVSGAKLIIDGEDTRAFDSADRQYFMRMVNRQVPGTIRDVEYVDSKKNAAIQIADMTAGAIRRALAGDADAARHETTFAHRFKFPRGSKWPLK